MPMAKYTIVYTEELEGGFSGRCLELPSAISQGETLEDLHKFYHEPTKFYCFSRAIEKRLYNCLQKEELKALYGDV